MTFYGQHLMRECGNAGINARPRVSKSVTVSPRFQCFIFLPYMLVSTVFYRYRRPILRRLQDGTWELYLI